MAGRLSMENLESTESKTSLLLVRLMKQNGNNYLQWRKIVDINLIGRGKKHHLYLDPPSS